nr:MAG: hypothetical protein EDM05_17630 [Leptolyngbya sp. IPPAS B-1204]
MTIQFNNIIITTDNSTALTYAITTNPNPLQINTTGSISIVVSKAAPPAVQCTSLSFSINTGIAAADLTMDPSTITTSCPPNWGVTSNGDGTFTFTPNPGQGTIGPGGLAFALNTIAVNEQVGTTDLYITETLQGGTSHGSIPIPKFPPNFTVSDLIATPPNNIQPGGSVNLSWNGTAGGVYTLSYGSFSFPNLPNVYNFPVGNLQQTTTFTLTVNAEGGTLQFQRQCTVTVLSPKIDSFGIVGNPDFVQQGSTIQVYWSTESIDHCALSVNGVPMTGESNLPASSSGYPITVPTVVGDCEFTLTAFPGPSNTGGLTSSTLANVFKFNVLPNPLAIPLLVSDMSISPDSSLLCLAGCLGLYFVSTAQQKIVHTTGASFSTSPLFSADGSHMFCGISSGIFHPTYEIQVFDTSTYQAQVTPAAQARYLKLAQGSAKGSLLVAGVADSTSVGSNFAYLYTLNPANNFQLVHQVQIPQNVITDLSLNSLVANPQGDQILVCTDSNFYIYQPNSNVLSSALLNQYNFTSAIFSPGGSRYYVATAAKALILVVDAAQNQLLGTINLPSPVRSGMAPAPDGKHLYAALINGTVVRIDLDTMRVIQTFQVGTAPSLLSLNPEGKHLYVVDTIDGTGLKMPYKLWTVEIADSSN